MTLNYEIHLRKNGRGYINPVPDPMMLLAKALHNSLHFTKDGKEYMLNPRFAEIHLYSKKTASFPIGFTQRVINIINMYGKHINEPVNILIKERREKATNIGLENHKVSHTLYPYQEKAKDIYLNNYLKMGILYLVTRSGKSFISVDIIKSINVRTLILVKSISLADQWHEHLSKEFGIKIGKIYNGKKDIQDITVGVDKSCLKYRTFLGFFNMLIHDECHNTSKTTRAVINSCSNCRYRLGLSATAKTFRCDGIRVESMMGKILYEIDRQTLIDGGFIVTAKVYYVSLSPRPDLRYKDYRDVYAEYILTNIERNNKIVEIAKKQTEKGLVLILIGEIDHGQHLFELLGGLNNKRLDYVHGKSKNRIERLKKAIDGDIDILISSTILDEGITLPNLKTVILCGAGKSFIRTIQRVGRSLGTHKDKTHAEIFDFADQCKYFDSHYHERRKILEEDFEVVDLN